MGDERQLHSPHEALAKCRQAMDRVMRETGFMVAIWGVKDGRVGLVEHTTWNYPMDDFALAVGQLTGSCVKRQLEDLLRKVLAMVPPPPLPDAAELPEIEGTPSDWGFDPPPDCLKFDPPQGEGPLPDCPKFDLPQGNSRPQPDSEENPPDVG